MAGRRKSPPERGWIDGREDHLTRSGQGAEKADRQDRGAWAGRSYKSPYAHLLNLPDAVGAGDKAGARAIMERLDLLIEQGGWTKNEWARIHKMQKAWRKRAAGEDPVFNVKGWQRKGDGHNLPPLLKAIVAIRKELEGES